MKFPFRFYLIGLLLLTFAPSSHASESKEITQSDLMDQDALNTLRKGVASVSGDKLQIELGFSAPPTPWVQLFLDADGDLDTGFVYLNGVSESPGWDFLLEGEILYTYTGTTPGEWKWAKTEYTLTRVQEGNSIRITLPTRALPPQAEIRLLAAAYSENYGTVKDLLPRGSASWKLKTPPAQSEKALPAPLLPVRSLDRRKAFDTITSYACFYGPGQVDRLSKRDAVIIETKNQSPESIARMQSEDTLVIGYISIGEDDELRVGDAQGPGGMDSSYFDRDQDQTPDRNAIWNSYYANASEPAWRRHFLNSAYEMRMRYGVDGFFLDTVDTSELYPESKAGMISLIRELRYQNPESIIVINRGFHVVEPLGADIDGVMFESFTSSWDWETSNYILMRPSAWDWGLEIYKTILKPAMEENGLVVLALDYAASAEAETVQTSFDRAATFGFVTEVANIQLDQIYDIDNTGHPDPKYLEVYTTPEILSYTLDTARNGFPKGTVIVPSSAYPDYEVAPIVDGVKDKNSLHWRNRAWASWEKASPHHVEFIFPTPVTFRGLQIIWATDNGKTYPSKVFTLEAKTSSEDTWVPLASLKDNTLAENTLSHDPVSISSLKLSQPVKGGSELRPNLMWIQSITIDINDDIEKAAPKTSD